MEVTLWGVRGSIPAPLSNNEYLGNVREILDISLKKDLKSSSEIEPFIDSLPSYLNSIVGGETTCVEVTNDSGGRLIIDCGSGLRRLGYKLMGQGYGDGNKELNILMTHTHWDHMLAWQFFIPAYIPGNTVHFHSTINDLKTRFERNQHPEHFPREFDDMPADTSFHLLQNGMDTEQEIDGFKINCISLKHPGGSTGFRIQADGKTFIFATDVEIIGDDILDLQKKHRSFFENVDMLLIDAQYSLEESFYKISWGHSTPSIVVNVASIFGIKKLILTHHEPSYDGKKLNAILEEAIDLKGQLGIKDLEIELGRQDSIYKL